MIVVLLFLLLPFVVLFLLFALYRSLNPVKHFPITDKLKHCVIGHRAAPIIPPSAATSTTHSTTDHTKGVYDKHGFIIPENTLPSFELAHISGMRTVELDVQFTKDGQCVVFHDQTIGATLQCHPNQSQLRICDIDYSELSAMPFLTTLQLPQQAPNPYQHARVTLFSDVLKFCKNNHMNIMIEVKPQPGLYQCCNAIASLVEQHKMEDSVYVASFSPLAGIYIRSFSSRICTGFLFTPSASTSIKLELERQNIKLPLLLQLSIVCWSIDSFFLALGHPFVLWLMGYSIVAPHFSFLSHYTVSRYRLWGLTVLTWTVNDLPTQEFIYNQLQATIITDHPKLDFLALATDGKPINSVTNLNAKIKSH